MFFNPGYKFHLCTQLTMFKIVVQYSMLIFFGWLLTNCTRTVYVINNYLLFIPNFTSYLLKLLDILCILALKCWSLKDLSTSIVTVALLLFFYSVYCLWSVVIHYHYLFDPVDFCFPFVIVDKNVDAFTILKSEFRSF